MAKFSFKNLGKGGLVKDAAEVGGVVIAAGLSRKYLDIARLFPNQPQSMFVKQQGWIKLIGGILLRSQVKNPMLKVAATGIAFDGGISAFRKLTGDFIPALSGYKWGMGGYQWGAGVPGVNAMGQGNQGYYLPNNNSYMPNGNPNYFQRGGQSMYGQPADQNASVAGPRIAGPNYTAQPEMYVAGAAGAVGR
jgi:hypothetical protein